MLSQVNGLLRAHSVLIILKYIIVDSLFSLQFHLWAAKIICLKFSHLEKTRQPKFVVNRHFKAGAGPDKDFVGIFIFSFFSHLVFLSSPSFVSLGVGWDYWGSRWQTDKAQILCNNDQQTNTTTTALLINIIRKVNSDYQRLSVSTKQQRGKKLPRREPRQSG